MLSQNFCEKYKLNILKNDIFDKDFTDLIKASIDCDCLKFILLGDNKFIQHMIIDNIIQYLDICHEDKLIVNNIKDQGITNIRYEIKLFTQTPTKKGKKILIVDDMHLFSESIQKLFINYIDKWSKNIHIIFTSNNIYNIDELLVTRLFPLNTPSIEEESLQTIINNICVNEDINISIEIVNYIIEISEKNIQNIYHILEKCKLLQISKPITMSIISDICTLISNNDLEKYFNIIKKKNIHAAYNYLLYITNNGHSVIDILNEVNMFLKNTNILTEEQKYKCCQVTCSYIVTFITIHEEEIELLLYTEEISEIF